jgi:hypothetical protein
MDDSQLLTPTHSSGDVSYLDVKIIEEKSADFANQKQMIDEFRLGT